MNFTLKTKWIAAIAGAFVLLLAAHAHAANAVYVGTTVSNPNAALGTRQNPYKSVEQARNAAIDPTFIITSPVGQVFGAESFHFTLALRSGSHGDEVTQLQTRLNADGATPALVVDGKFGAKAAAALMKWQAAHGLAADGKVGPKTVAALNA